MMPTSTGDPRSARGFTMLELLVVLAVLAMTAAWAGPRFWRGEKALMREATALVRAEIDDARLNALTTRRPVTLWFDLEQRTIAQDGGPVRHMPGDFAIHLTTARELVATPGRAAIRFYGDGSATGGALRFGKDGPRLIVDWLTGVPHAAP